MVIKKLDFLFVISMFFSVLFLVNAVAVNDTMIVEANIFSLEDEDMVGVEVTERVVLGDVNVGEESDKKVVYVNNTGTVDIVVTLQLEDSSDDIFSNLFFQNRQSGNNSEVFQIGDYSFEINEPSSSGGKRAEHFSIWLDLTDFDGELEQGTNNYQAEVVFIALPKL